MQKFRKWWNYWNHIQNVLYFMFEGYLQIILACYLNTLQVVETSFGDRLSHRLGNILAVVTCAILPLFLLFLTSFSRDKLNLKQTRKRYGYFFKKLNVRRKYALRYNLYFLARKVMFIFFIFWSPLTSYSSI